MTLLRRQTGKSPTSRKECEKWGTPVYGFLWLLKYDQIVSFNPAGQLWFTPGKDDQLTVMPLLQPERVFEASTGWPPAQTLVAGVAVVQPSTDIHQPSVVSTDETVRLLLVTPQIGMVESAVPFISSIFVAVATLAGRPVVPPASCM